ncbi:transmembrane protein 80 isoform X1 [Loxodonta africana]|uniref:transmembrane protein 80 isoform X1 n=1 Tax=Loxodonta africana TaxID=9785 RepID=UPI0030D574BC
MFPSPKPPPRASALRLLLSESARALPDGLLGPRPRFGCQLLRRRSAGPLREQKRKWPKGRERRGAQRLPGSRRTRRAGAGQDGGRQARERLLHRALIGAPADGLLSQWSVSHLLLPGHAAAAGLQKRPHLCPAPGQVFSYPQPHLILDLALLLATGVLEAAGLYFGESM